MSVELRRRAKAVFLDALEQPDDDRHLWIASACGDDVDLRHAVESLLRAHEQSEGFLHEPLIDGAAFEAPAESAPSRSESEPGRAASAVDEERPGSRIGPYRLIEPIGEGGFGTVHLAEQTSPVRRPVALKILRLGMDSREVTARFEAERQALALMSHPNIATVFDAGTTASGRPFFVMEHVPGVPINTFCDAHELTAVERLELFVDVCAAVQHAHQKGVIHRDLKPSNVMVTLRDGVGVPKVIDFGIAKATEAGRADEHFRTDFRPHFRTESRQLVGTPEYMSPEQAEPSPDIDTRSDIYALGVLLYELLTGTTPFDPERLRSASFGEIQRIICEEEPPRPSTRIGTLGSAREDIARRRRTDGRSLVRTVRGDLDWIVMRCLEKDRARRYATANDLAVDIRRHLDGEAVLACPPSTSYLVAKYAQRHRVGIGVAALFLLLLVGSTIVGWALYVEAGRARRDADLRASDAFRAQAMSIAALQRSMLGEAAALRQSSVHDRRALTLGLIVRAAEIGVTPQIRSEAIAALTLAGIEISREWRAFDPPWAALDFDASNRRWAMAAPDGSIEIRSVDDSAALQVLPPIGHRVGHVAFAPRAPEEVDLLLVKYDDPTMEPSIRIVVWDLRSMRRVIDRESDHSPGVPVFDRQGAHVALLVEPTHALVVRTVDGTIVDEIATDGPVSCLRFDATGTRLAVAMAHAGEGGGTRYAITLHDLTGAPASPRPTEPARVVVPAFVRGIAWSRDGRRLAAACGDFRAYLCDLDHAGQFTQRWPQALAGHQAEVVDAIFSPDGRWLMTSSWDNTTRLWDTNALRELATVVGYMVPKQELDPATKLPFRRRDGTIGLWKLELPDRIVASLPAHTTVKGPNHADISPDGRIVISAAGDGLAIWDIDEAAPIELVETGSIMQALFHSIDGADSIFTNGMGGLRRWSFDAGSARPRPVGSEVIVAEASPAHHVRWVARSHDGTTIVYSGRNIPITVHDPRSGATRQPMGDRVLEGRFSLSPDGSSIGWSDPYEGIVIADLRRGEVIRRIESPPAAELAFSPCGTYLVSNTDEIVIRRCADWSEVGRQRGSSDPLLMRSLAISPDSSIVAAVVEMERIMLIDLRTAELIATLHAPTPAYLNWLGFTPDGSRLVAVGWHQLQRWNLDELRRRLAGLGLDW